MGEVVLITDTKVLAMLKGGVGGAKGVHPFKGSGGGGGGQVVLNLRKNSIHSVIVKLLSIA